MKYRRLPKTDLNLSEIGFGVWTLVSNSVVRIDERDASDLLLRAYDREINFFDTEDIYGRGYGEELLGNVFRKKRHEVIIATKGGYDFHNTIPWIEQPKLTQCFDPGFIKLACEQSLKRLKTDYIDIYQLHNPELTVLEKEDILEILELLVKEGKIRYYAFALSSDMSQIPYEERELSLGNIRSLQIDYSILNQEASRYLFPIAKREGIGLISREPHASGILTDMIVTPYQLFDSDQFIHTHEDLGGKYINNPEILRFLGEDSGRSLSQSAIKFCLAEPSIISVLPNITNTENLNDYILSSDSDDLLDSELLRIKKLWQSGFEVIGSEYY
ncbi:aldo/keto reductase [SAR202 cluster bacterium AC-409-J13_OGT_754m]|nr:aldo/keto reductase [SAR202 cluster bacterium AC-409-J13_OGT_754m]